MRLISQVANAVARVENLEFLTDVVPKTISFKQAKQKAREAAAAATVPSEGTVESSEPPSRAPQDQPRQPRIEDAMQSRPMLPEQMLSPPPVPVSTAAKPEGSPQVVIESQAINGATQHVKDDQMDVDDDAGSMHTAKAEMSPPAVEVKMAGAP